MNLSGAFYKSLDNSLVAGTLSSRTVSSQNISTVELTTSSGNVNSILDTKASLTDENDFTGSNNYFRRITVTDAISIPNSSIPQSAVTGLNSRIGETELRITNSESEISNIKYNAANNVLLTGEQTIIGKKRFASDIELDTQNQDIIIKGVKVAKYSPGETSYKTYQDLTATDERVRDVITYLKKDTDIAYAALQTVLNGKQNVLTFDTAPVENSQNLLKSGSVYTALSTKQNSLLYDDLPTANSANIVASGSVYTALQGVQAGIVNFEFDQVPTESSSSLVSSGGIYDALSLKVGTNLYNTEKALKADIS